MIKTEIIADGLILTYSDVGKRIQKVGTDEIYDEAVDIATAGYNYIETGDPIDISDTEALEIITGGESA